MEGNVGRKPIELNAKLLAILKQIAQDTGLSLGALCNLAVYELARRLGHLSHPPHSVPVPEGAELLEKAVPVVPLVRKAAHARPPAASSAPPSGEQREDVLYCQVDDGPYVPIRKQVFLIGRGSKCDCMLKHRGASREHAVVTRERGGWHIEDLSSANGTFLNGGQITKHKLSGGDEIQISDHILRFTIRPG